MEHQNEMKFFQWPFINARALHSHILKLPEFIASLHVFAGILPAPMGADIFLINLSARKERVLFMKGRTQPESRR